MQLYEGLLRHRGSNLTVRIWRSLVALVDTMHHWHAAIDKRQSVRTVFVDFAKAFDHIDNNVLVIKLVALGLSDVIVRWMCAFLRHRRQRVKIGDVLSDWLQLAAGMPLGFYLGPAH